MRRLTSSARRTARAAQLQAHDRLRILAVGRGPRIASQQMHRRFGAGERASTKSPAAWTPSSGIFVAPSGTTAKPRFLSSVTTRSYDSRMSAAGCAT